MRRMLLGLAVLVLAGGAGPTPGQAQETVAARPLALVDAPAIRLGDVFEGTGDRATRTVGAAPAPGRRLVLEAGQLVALARMHGLAWRPLTSNERVVIERPGRAIPREDIEAVLRTDLARLGLDPNAELELGPLLPPMVPPAALVQLTTEGVTLEGQSGRFAATLVVMADDMPTQRLRLAGRAAPTVAVVVATRRLGLNDVVGPHDVRLVRLRTERVRSGTADDPSLVVGRQLRRPQAADQPFMLVDLAPPAVVGKNTLVTMIVESPGITVTAQGRALDSAPQGGVIPVMNLASRAVVEAQVIGPGRVRVAMGAAPISR